MQRITGAILFFVFVPIIVHSQQPKEIIYAFLNLSSGGDIKNWNSVTSLYMESEDLFLDNNVSNPGNFNVIPQPQTHKVYRVWPEKSMTEIYEGPVLVSSFYHVNKNHFVVMKGQDPIEIGTGPYEPYFEFEPMLIKHVIDKSTDIKLIGVRKLDDDDYYDIKVTTKKLIWHFYFNVQNSLLGYWGNSVNDSQETLTKLSDYEKFDNFLIATSEAKYREDKLFFAAKRKKIVFNIDISEDQFNYKTKSPKLIK